MAVSLTPSLSQRESETKERAARDFHGKASLRRRSLLLYWSESKSRQSPHERTTEVAQTTHDQTLAALLRASPYGPASVLGRVLALHQTPANVASTIPAYRFRMGS
jgi:hypothetical protein